MGEICTFWISWSNLGGEETFEIWYLEWNHSKISQNLKIQPFLKQKNSKCHKIQEISSGKYICRGWIRWTKFARKLKFQAKTKSLELPRPCIQFRILSFRRRTRHSCNSTGTSSYVLCFLKVDQHVLEISAKIYPSVALKHDACMQKYYNQVHIIAMLRWICELPSGDCSRALHSVVTQVGQSPMVSHLHRP